MKDNEKKELILNFIKKHTLAVLSTISSKSKPEAAVIEFSEKNNLELIFDTFKNFRKYNNLKGNNNVAVVIGWDKNITTQYEGIAVEINNRELTEYQKIHITKLPNAEKFLHMAGIKFFKIIPKWIRYSNLNTNPWEIIELSF
ncbi:MAG: Pyridoxamine 5'-phosphate oxidase [archaeon GW2011_AR20]|nr:MAG: Pyridoxamine 5'-phosphate oxidase [archaeon GW2011_AR20]MBS3160938.1 pyridoxamine 5'-phosphate oxidase family protein [Candidatus Woesearchaeota archaeon]